MNPRENDREVDEDGTDAYGRWLLQDLQEQCDEAVARYRAQALEDEKKTPSRHKPRGSNKGPSLDLE